MQLDMRKKEVLQAIVDDYVSTNEPVGSKSLIERHNFAVSSATLRNEMAELEHMGLIEKPHTSAGRIPSDKGYRFYVDNLMKEKIAEVEAIEVSEDKLNEEFQKENPRSLRMSRHLYDMYLLKDTEFGREALTDTDLYETIVKHRSLYYVDKRVDYNRHHPSLINFCPPDKVIDAWKSDYANMLESFIYGKAPSFDELMESMKSMLDDFRRVKVKDNILE